MNDKKQDEKETERRRDEALRQALSTPPVHHTPKGKSEPPQKPKGESRK